MRRVAVLLGVGVVGLAVACSRGDRTTPPAPNTVRVHFSCDNSGGQIGVAPWRVSLDLASPAKWVVPMPNVTVYIIPKDTAKWPFISKDPIQASQGKDGVSSAYDPNSKESLYKYKVMGVCVHGSDQDTVILDPDMIIPTRLQAEPQ